MTSADGKHDMKSGLKTIGKSRLYVYATRAIQHTDDTDDKERPQPQTVLFPATMP